MRKIFSLIAAVLFAGSMMAEAVTLLPTDVTTIESGATSGLDVTLQGVHLVWQGAFYNNDNSKDFRVYASSTMTLTAESNIVKVEIAGYCKANFTLTADAGEVTTGASYASATTKADLNDPLIVIDNINATTVTLTAGKQLQARQIRVTLGEGGDVEPTEVFYLTGSIRNWAQTADDDYKFVVNTAAEGEYMLQGITLAANDELKVIGLVGETVNWYPAGQDNNYVVAADGTYDIYFRPDGQGGQDWHQGYFYVAEVVPATAITCLDVYQMAKGDAVDLLNDVTVTFANGKNVWVVDGSASMLIYFSANTNYAPGDVLSGIAGTVDIYNGVTEIKPSADQAAAIVATPGEAPAAIQTVVVEAADVNKYIVMPEIEFEEDAAFAEGTASNITMNGVVVRNNFKNGFAFEAGKKYNVYGVVTLYQSNPQVYFITAEEATETAINNTNVDAQVVKFFENGQLIIIKNGVRYNAQGAVVR